MTKIFNRSTEREKRKLLRNNMTESEKILWARLRKRQVNGVRFRRQYSIGSYIVDFYSVEHKLAIEVDGTVHLTDDAVAYDKYRDEYINSLGIQIIRFTNDEVLLNANFVVSEIKKTLENIQLF